VQGWKLAADWSHSIDQLLVHLFRNAEEEFFRRYPRLGQRCALIALGGYGRQELCPYSDIDLLFLYPYKVDAYVETVAERVLYILWDLGLDVGYSTRSIKGCLKIAMEDYTARNALIDARLISGDSSLFNELIKETFSKLYYRNANTFIQEKWEELQTRHKKFGSSVYVLEPHLKEGPGGLRDLHAVLWASKAKFKIDSFKDLLQKGVITARQWTVVSRSWDFHLRTRIVLHDHVGRRQDQLTFELQAPLAEKLGFKQTRRGTAAENFLHSYYAYASSISQFTEELFERLDERLLGKRSWTRIRPCKGFEIYNGKLHVADLSHWGKDPIHLMRAFQIFQKYNVELSSTLKELIREGLGPIDATFCKRPEAQSLFHEIISEPKGLSRTFLQMHELKFFGRLIPQFGRLYRKAQHDLYHVYTVDVHSIFAVREFERLYLGEYAGEFPLLHKMAQETKDLKSQILGILFHDIGKGLGGGHVAKGMRMIPQISKRLGLSPEEEEKIIFLVEHHLLMPHIAQRRDMHDEKLIIRFARTVGNLERLQMLYLLAFCDIRAVGPEVWTGWKGMLFQELYLKTVSVLEKGTFEEVGEEAIATTRKETEDILFAEYPKNEVVRFLDSFDYRYFLYVKPNDVARHFRLDKGLEGRAVILEKWDHSDKGYSEIIVVTWDRPGLFSEIAGVLSANGINILGAQIHVRKSGRILDLFQANDAYSRGPILNEERWKRVEQDMLRVVKQEISVEDLLAKRKERSLLHVGSRSRAPSRVVLDNNDSDRYTVIEVYTLDRPGLLYNMTRTLYHLGLTIDLSKISTKVDQVADVFYVKNFRGEKIVSEEMLERIRTELLAAVEPKAVV
jgi:[protein-PII] uridylyltransferase